MERHGERRADDGEPQRARASAGAVPERRSEDRHGEKRDHGLGAERDEPREREHEVAGCERGETGCRHRARHRALEDATKQQPRRHARDERDEPPQEEWRVRQRERPQEHMVHEPERHLRGERVEVVAERAAAVTCPHGGHEPPVVEEPRSEQPPRHQGTDHHGVDPPVRRACSRRDAALLRAVVRGAPGGRRRARAGRLAGYEGQRDNGPEQRDRDEQPLTCRGTRARCPCRDRHLHRRAARVDVAAEPGDHRRHRRATRHHRFPALERPVGLAEPLGDHREHEVTRGRRIDRRGGREDVATDPHAQRSCFGLDREACIDIVVVRGREQQRRRIGPSDGRARDGRAERLRRVRAEQHRREPRVGRARTRTRARAGGVRRVQCGPADLRVFRVCGAERGPDRAGEREERGARGEPGRPPTCRLHGCDQAWSARPTTPPAARRSISSAP